ncbi:MAG: hypothetical protein JW969_18355 [Spirochaetales bacterium]|nr:hypothetical protein [Spirochaetales bacterium]
MRFFSTVLLLATLAVPFLQAQDAASPDTKKLQNEFTELTDQLKAAQADLYYPERYVHVQTLFTGLEKRMDDGEREKIEGESNRAKEEAGELLSLVNDKIIWIHILKDDIISILDKAEEIKAYEWGRDILDEVNDYYFRGIDALDNHDLEKAENHFIHAKKLALEIIDKEEVLKTTQLQALKEEALKLLEKTSQLTVADDNGNIIMPFPFDVDAFSKEAAEEIKVYTRDTVSAPDTKRVIPLEELWSTGRDFIKLGLWEESNSNAIHATAFFSRAKNLLNKYASQEVYRLYTVKWKAGRKECLWTIAGYPFIYGDPFLWPKIWVKNKYKIKDPTVILPGWVLIIPVK